MPKARRQPTRKSSNRRQTTTRVRDDEESNRQPTPEASSRRTTCVREEEESDGMEFDVVEVAVFGPPPLHPQYLVVTDDSLDCICGCQRTIESVAAEKKARRTEKRALRDAAIAAEAMTNVVGAAGHAVPAITTNITVAPIIHVPSGSHLGDVKISPVIHLRSGVSAFLAVSPVIFFGPTAPVISVNTPIAEDDAPVPADNAPAPADVPIAVDPMPVEIVNLVAAASAVSTPITRSVLEGPRETSSAWGPQF